MVFVSVKFLLKWSCWVPEEVGVDSSISRFFAMLAAEKIDSPFQFHVLSELFISDNQLAHTLFNSFSGNRLGFNFLICLFS